MPKERLKRLLEKANGLPSSPGVYIMRSRGGTVIYVGKSKSLKNRVSQYFQNTGSHSIKTARMIDAVEDFDYILCDTELESLALENIKIKQYSPKYNIKLKDDKNYPYIKVTKNEMYPRLVMCRRIFDDKCDYFGPYSCAQTARTIIRTVGKIYGIPQCKRVFPRDIGRGRPCLNYQIGRCVGLCTGNISEKAYTALIDEASYVLRGDISAAKKLLTGKMNEASESLAYEAAAKYRDRINALSHLYEKQKVISSPRESRDAFGIYRDEGITVISVFYIRGGMIYDTENFPFSAEAISECENLSSFLIRLYEKRASVPPEILISEKLPEGEDELLAQYLHKMTGRRHTVRTPQRGERKKLCDMVCANAAQQAKQHEADAVKQSSLLVSLAAVLGLEVVPQRIEAYDISNYGNENITAGMVVYEDGKPKKRDYRSFNIKSTEIQNDYSSMCEALRRRIEAAQKQQSAFLPLPDLILLDGGRTHVSVIKELFESMGVDIPVFGMVKDEYHKTRSLCDDTHELSIAKNEGLFILIYKIQEEVHRFTVGKMTNAKRKTLKTSSLTQIKGIGEAKAKRLLVHFGSLQALKEADREQLCEVAGITAVTADAVIEYFKQQQSKDERTAPSL